MKRILVLLTAILTCAVLRAQTAQDSVKAAINQFFDGMRNADAQMVQSSFADSAILQTVVVNREGKVSVRNEPLSGFAAVLNRQKKGDLDERI
jgi:ketosteroid isomerase-like protein